MSKFFLPIPVPVLRVVALSMLTPVSISQATPGAISERVIDGILRVIAFAPGSHILYGVFTTNLESCTDSVLYYFGNFPNDLAGRQCIPGDPQINILVGAHPGC
jgi:hypothetical protein